MAEEEKTAEQNAEDKPAGGSKKKFLIIGIAALLVILVGGGVGFFFLKGNSESPPPPSQQDPNAQATSESPTDPTATPAGGTPAGGGDGTKPADKPAEQKDATSTKPKTSSEINFGETYTLKPFHLNLGNPLENRYLRLHLAFEYKGGESQLKEIEARQSQIRDAIVAVASRKTREALLSVDGKDQLRLEILHRVNQYMDKKIEAVYITDILIE